MRSLLHHLLSDEVLARTVLGAPVEDWLLLFGALALAALLTLCAQGLIAWRIRWSAGRETTWIEQAVTNVLERTRAYFLFALALSLAARFAGWSARGLAWTVGLVTLAALLQAGRWITGLIALWIEQYKEEKLEVDAASVTSMQALGILARIAVWSVIGLLFLANLGVDVTALVAGLGIGGVAIGLAVQNILSDLFASLSIVLDKPFVIGDFLAVGDDVGTVEYIGLKSTRVRSISGEQLIFSNGDLLESRVRNYRRMTERRVVFDFGVTYDTAHAELEAIPDLVREIVEEVSARADAGVENDGTDARALPPLRFDRAHFKAFGASALEFEVAYYVLSSEYARYMDAQQAINLALVDAFEERGIAFAFPTRTVHIDGMPGRGAAGNKAESTVPST